MALRFIPFDVALAIHADLLRRYGGKQGLRDSKLLDSALAQAKMTMGGKFVHRTVFEKAAAYGYHVCGNHPFVDGNKRVAFVLMDMFLLNNGWEITAGEEEAFLTMMALASGQLTKAQLAAWLKEHSSKIRER
jgi:death-on-curing protein